MNTAAIANHLNVVKEAITEVQEWARVLWVRVKGLGCRFVSKSVVSMKNKPVLKKKDYRNQFKALIKATEEYLDKTPKADPEYHQPLINKAKFLWDAVSEDETKYWGQVKNICLPANEHDLPKQLRIFYAALSTALENDGYCIDIPEGYVFDEANW